VTEGEWLACTDPTPMLEFLRGKVSDRKLRLFACACCRRVRHLLNMESGQTLAEISERYADRLATEGELEAALAKADDDFETVDHRTQSGEDAASATLLAAVRGVTYASDAAWYSTKAVGYTASSHGGKCIAEAAERHGQADLLRGIFGNPFRLVSLDPAWQTPTVLALAQSIYDQRAFERLPELADALEKAGCTNAYLLAHCRQPGPHVRGCWVVDLILGKE
jgi:hypothetical protein